MSHSRLLAAEEEYSEDEEFRLSPVREDRYLNTSFHQPPYFQTTDSSDNEDMEAPPSLILEQHTLPTTTHKSTRDHVSTYDRTMWRWANVENMDDFFNRVYEYFQGKGLYCILLARLLNLL